MKNTIGEIRKKAFQEEMSIVVPEYFKQYSNPKDSYHLHLQNLLEKYLSAYFNDYLQWRFQIQKDSITFQIATLYADFSSFTLRLEKD